MLQLEEIWRIGGEEDQENLLGVVDKVLADDEGNVYLLDIQLTEVQVFSPKVSICTAWAGPAKGRGKSGAPPTWCFCPMAPSVWCRDSPAKSSRWTEKAYPPGNCTPAVMIPLREVFSPCGKQLPWADSWS